VKRTFAQKIYEQDVESHKKWLCDKGFLNVQQGLDGTVLQAIPSFVLSEIQKNKLADKLTSSMRFSKFSVSNTDGIVTIDDDLVLRPYLNNPGKLGNRVFSRSLFIKLLYQYISSFPTALSEAYQEITGESLILDDLSEVRAFYEHCSQFDLWTGHELCAYISHCDPEALDFLSENPEIHELLSEAPEPGNSNPDKLEKLLPKRFFRAYIRPDLYEENLPLVKSAILGGAFELVHFDQEDWLKSSLKPKKGLEWAKTKGIDYHPVLDEYLLDFDKAAPAISSGYTTPYLEMMQEVIRELEISKENQGKKEAIAALFAKKINDHKMTPPSQKLADAMATLVRLPESQQGRARRKG